MIAGLLPGIVRITLSTNAKSGAMDADSAVAKTVYLAIIVPNEICIIK